MKLSHGAEIGSEETQVDANVDVDDLDSDTDSSVGDTDDTRIGMAGEKPGHRGLGGLLAMLRTALRSIALTSGRRLSHATAFSWRGIRALLARWRLIALSVTVVAAVALASALYLLQYRPNQQTDDVAAHAAIKAASEGTVALLSYSPETLDNDVAAGTSHLTGQLLQYFTGFSHYFVTPSVRQQRVRATASVLRAAVADLHPKSAVVLLFVHQTTTSKDKPDPVLTTNSLRVTLTKVNDSWLIAKFEPE